jgi:hypothetical protein
METNREVVKRYHEAYERANSTTIGTPEFVAAMAEVRRIWHELRAAGVQPNETWRRRDQGKLRERARDDPRGARPRDVSSGHQEVGAADMEPRA